MNFIASDEEEWRDRDDRPETTREFLSHRMGAKIALQRSPGFWCWRCLPVGGSIRLANSSTLPLRSICHAVASAIFLEVGSSVPREGSPSRRASSLAASEEESQVLLSYPTPQILSNGVGGTPPRPVTIKLTLAYVLTEAVVEDRFHVGGIDGEIDEPGRGVDVGGVEFDNAAERRAELGSDGDIAFGRESAAELGAEDSPGVDRDATARRVRGIGGDIAVFEGNEAIGRDRNVAAGKVAGRVGLEKAAATQDDGWGVELQVAALPPRARNDLTPVENLNRTCLQDRIAGEEIIPDRAIGSVERSKIPRGQNGAIANFQLAGNDADAARIASPFRSHLTENTARNRAVEIGAREENGARCFDTDFPGRSLAKGARR